MEERYFEATLRALSEHHADFKSVDLSGHAMNDEKVTRLASALKKNKVITTLELFGLNLVTLNGWRALSDSLPSQITTLDLGKCELGRENQESVQTVLGGISRLSQMEELDLNGNGITSESVPALCKALQGLPSLKELMIQNNNLGNEGSFELAKCLNHYNKHLETIWMQNNRLDAAGKAAVKSELSRLQNLSRLELGQE